MLELSRARRRESCPSRREDRGLLELIMHRACAVVVVNGASYGRDSERGLAIDEHREAGELGAWTVDDRVS